MKDYYYILGVDANCTADDVKEAYRKLSKKFHPDLNQNDGYFESRFKEIQEAYDILSDPRSRRRYDDQFINSKIYSSDPEPTKKRRYPRTTAVDIIFTLILIGITVLFGNYVLTSMNAKSKPAKVSEAPVVADTAQVVATPVKHHKKKKHILIAVNISKPKPVLAAKPVTPATSHPVTNINPVTKIITKASVKIKADTFKPQPVAQVIHPALPVRNVSNTEDNSIPYSSYLRANITGVVNMHRSESLNSDIVNVIPSHTKVLVLQKGGTYYKVQFNGDEGFVPKWTVLTK